MFIHAPLWVPERDSLPQLILQLDFRQGFPLTLELTDLSILTCQGPQDSPCLFLLSAGCVPLYPDFHMNAGDPSLDPHECVAGTSQARLSPQALVSHYFTPMFMI